jgi:hypothetical protein
MVGALTIEGCIIGLFVIANGIYVIAFPPVNDEPQGYAIITIGSFILLVTLKFTREQDTDRGSPPPR